MTMHELECKSAVFPAVSNCSVHYNSDIQYVYCVSKFNVENVIKAKYAIYCAGRGAGGDCDQHRCTTSCSRRAAADASSAITTPAGASRQTRHGRGV